MPEQNGPERLAGDVVAADHAGVFFREPLQREELAAFRRAETVLLGVLKEQDHVLSKRSALEQTGKTQQGSGVAVVAAEMPCPVRRRHRVVVCPDDNGSFGALVMLRIEPAHAIHDLKICMLTQKGLDICLCIVLHPGSFSQSAERLPRLDHKLSCFFVHSDCLSHAPPAPSLAGLYHAPPQKATSLCRQFARSPSLCATTN